MTANMNWKRGAFRLWVIVSVLWVGGMGIYQNQQTKQADENSVTIAMEDSTLRIDADGIRKENPQEVKMQRLGWVILPPLLLLLVIPVGGWLTRGFKPETK